MTICIAAIYGKNEGIVAVADKMFTSAPGILTVHEVNENNKIIKLTNTTLAMMAGNVTNASSIITELTTGLLESDTVEQIAVKTGEIYKTHCRKALEDEALSRWGLTLEDFIEKQQTLDRDLVTRLNQVVAEASLEVEIIIAGCDTRGPGIYIITNPGAVNCLNSIGIAYIGSGAAHASLSAVDSQYQKSDDIGRVLFTAFKAKKRAEYDPNVGKYTSICLVNERVKEFTDDEIKDLYAIYENSNQKTLEIIKDVTIELRKKYDGNTRTQKSR